MLVGSIWFVINNDWIDQRIEKTADEVISAFGLRNKIVRSSIPPVEFDRDGALWIARVSFTLPFPYIAPTKKTARPHKGTGMARNASVLADTASLLLDVYHC